MRVRSVLPSVLSKDNTSPVNGPKASLGPVWAAVVCYRPPSGSIAALVSRLCSEVDHILLLDNSPGFDLELSSLDRHRVEYLPMPSNLGTGAALNRAWQVALYRGAGALISFDQDSMPEAGATQRLRATIDRLILQGESVAGIGPARVDSRSGAIAWVMTPMNWRRRMASPDGQAPILADHLISSGALIPAYAYQHCGAFNEGLFLDYVDIEWSLRARKLGLKLYIDPGARMTHVIGDELVRIGPYSFPRHQAIRSFLQIRNHLLMWRGSSASWVWLLHDGVRQFGKHFLLILRGPRRLERIRWVFWGVLHGLSGREGPPPF